MYLIFLHNKHITAKIINKYLGYNEIFPHSKQIYFLTQLFTDIGYLFKYARNQN
jgi:hypothetical protein